MCIIVKFCRTILAQRTRDRKGESLVKQYNAKHIRKNYPYRIMEAKWREQAQGSFRVTIAITINDTAGVVNQITEVVSRDLKLNIRTINLSSRGDGTGVGTISVEVPSTSVVDMLLHAIMRIKGVQRAVRVNN